MTNYRWLRPGLFVVPTLFLGLSHVYAAEAFLPNSFGALVIGYEEVPPVFTVGSGSLQLTIKKGRTSVFFIKWQRAGKRSTLERR